MGLRCTVLVALGVVAAPAIVRADAPPSFEQLAAQAAPVGRGELAGLAWLMTATCDQGDDLARRQCRGVRDGRLAQLRARPLLVAGDGAAFIAGDWDGARRALPLTLRGCIACAGIEVDGARFYMVAAAPIPASSSSIPPAPGAPAAPPDGVVIEGDRVQAAVLYAATRSFYDESSAKRWRTEVLPRLRTQLLVRLAASQLWHREGKDGIALELIGYRVHDPCTGVIVTASPPSAPVKPEDSACSTEVLAARAGAATAAQLPAALTPAQVREALEPAAAAARVCHETYGVAGEARFRITIGADGTIVGLVQEGDFADTPTGACVEKAVRRITFPATQKARTTIVYPIVLR